MNKILYIGEGEIEKYFLQFLKENNFIYAGRYAKQNLLQDKLKETSGILTNKFDKVFCILDTDCLSDKFLNNLVSNLNKLKFISKNKMVLLIQNKNFEDELKYIFNCNDLGKFLNLKNKTKSDIKRYLADKINYSRYISKEKLIKYCSRFEEFQQILLDKNIKLSRAEILTIRACMKK